MSQRSPSTTHDATRDATSLQRVLATTTGRPVSVTLSIEEDGQPQPLILSMDETAPTIVSLKQALALRFQESGRSPLFPDYLFHYTSRGNASYAIWVSMDNSGIRTTEPPELRIISYDTKTHVVAEAIKDNRVIRRLRVRKGADEYDDDYVLYHVIDSANSERVYRTDSIGALFLYTGEERRLFVKMQHDIHNQSNKFNDRLRAVWSIVAQNLRGY